MSYKNLTQPVQTSYSCINVGFGNTWGLLYIKGAEWKTLVCKSHNLGKSPTIEGMLRQVKQGTLQQGRAKTFLDGS